jgi:hypothetical protein
MFGWYENNKIAAVLRIGIVTLQLNVNLMFWTVRIIVVMLFRMGDEIVVVLLNSSLPFQTNNSNNISII